MNEPRSDEPPERCPGCQKPSLTMRMFRCARCNTPYCEGCISDHFDGHDAPQPAPEPGIIPSGYVRGGEYEQPAPSGEPGRVDCCMAAHQTAKAPWTCKCDCHTKQPEPEPASGKEFEEEVRDGCTQDGAHDPPPCPRCERLRAAHRCEVDAARREGIEAAEQRGRVQGYKTGAWLVKNARKKILDNPSDPSWTEHFAELIEEFERRSREGGE